MLSIDQQNETMQYFLQLHHELQHTRADLSSDTGALEINGNSVTLKSNEKVFGDTGTESFHYVLTVDRGRSRAGDKIIPCICTLACQCVVPTFDCPQESRTII